MQNKSELLNLLSLGKTQEVLERAEVWHKQDRTSEDALYLLGLAYLFLEDYESSIKYLKRALQKSKKNYQYLGNLGVALLRNKEYDSAIYHLQKALKEQPDYYDAGYNLGCAYLENQQADEALKLFHALTDKVPDNMNYLCAVADAHREKGQWQKAVAIYEKVLTTHDLARAHNNLGGLLQHFGELDRAVEHCKKAIELSPADISAYKNLGDCYVQLEMLDEAMEAYADAYDINSESSELCVAIGDVWQEVGDRQEASTWFDKAVQLDEGNIKAQCGLAKLVSDTLGTDAAIEMLEPLLEENSDNIDLLLLLSDVYWDDGDADLAMQLLEKVRALQPQRLIVLSKMGHILSSSGDVDQAVAIYNEALGQNANFVPALNGLATTLKSKLDTSYIEKMEELLASSRIDKSGMLSSLHSGLAYYYDGCKDAEKAASHMMQANKYQWEYRSKRDWDYEVKTQENHISQIIETFDANYFATIRDAGIGSDSEMPVFIVGMPRSGTTLTEQIIARHSSVLGIGERSFANQSFHAFNQGSKFQREQYLPIVSVENIASMAEQYLERLQLLIDKAQEQGVTRVVDKMPDNYSLVGWILTLFPKAKIIHCRRDPRDVSLSCWMTQFGSIPWACHEKHLVERVRQYLRIMRHWKSVLPVNYYVSDYEQLVANQEEKSKELIEFIGLDWQEQCLEFYESDRLVRTASITQVRQPIYKNSVAKWERYKDHIQDLMEPLTELIEEHGY